MSKDKICVVSVGVDGREPYSQYVETLKQKAIENGYAAMVWKNEMPPNCPAHQDVPYAFKPYAIQAALDEGYTKIFWMDSKCHIVSKITPVEEALDEHGYWFVEDGMTVGEWCKDSALPLLGVTREEAYQMKVIAAKHFALNLEHDIAKQFFKRYMGYAVDNNGEAYRGPWQNNNSEASVDPNVRGHRHDQTCGSVIREQLGMKMFENNVVDWRDGWKFRGQSGHHGMIEPLVLFDGYLHGSATSCPCQTCRDINQKIVDGTVVPPNTFWRD